MINAAITAVGGYVPEDILTNEDLEKMVDTSDQWIRERTGIIERRILKGIRGASEMVIPAVEQILKKKNLDPLEIDLLIIGTISSDFVFPSTANIVCDAIGAKNAWGFDLAGACSGFIYALETGRRFVESGAYKKVVVVGVDKMSSIIDYEDRNTCIIFGDGCGAVLLEPDEDGFGIQDAIMKSDGSGLKYLNMKAGGSKFPSTIETVTNREHYVYQEGKAVFKFAVKQMAQVSVDLMDRNNLSAEDVNWLVPHQANLRIIEATRARTGLAPEKVMLNIHKYGNTTAGTIPLCLWDYESQLKKGDNLILSAFGGGFTWGSIYVKWAY